MNEDQASECFMCKEYRPHGCLECRTHRLLSDIRTGIYEKMGLEQNRTEWEGRALLAESRLSHLSAVNEKLVEALKNRVHCLACQTHEHPTTAEALKLADEMGEP